jgi:hypothetical protein
LNLALTGSRPSVIGSTSIYPEATVGPIFASAGAAGTAAGETLSRYGGPGTYTGAISNGSMAVLNRVMAAGLTTTAAGITAQSFHSRETASVFLQRVDNEARGHLAGCRFPVLPPSRSDRLQQFSRRHHPDQDQTDARRPGIGQAPGGRYSGCYFQRGAHRAYNRSSANPGIRRVSPVPVSPLAAVRF